MKSAVLCVVAVSIALALPLGVRAQPHPGLPHGGGQVAPFAGGGKPMTSEEALKEAPKLDKDLVPLEKAMNEAQAKLKKKPKDAKLKAAYVEATYKYGHTLTNLGQGKMSPRIQYRAALALYRHALKVDPKHKGCLADKKQIEDIYKSMGMPVPS